MHLSLATATAVGLLCAVSPSWPLLLVGRGVQGVALAGLPAVGVAYLIEELHPQIAGRATGLYVGGNAIGGMVGRLLAGVLNELGGWRVAVGGIGLLALGCTTAVGVLSWWRHSVCPWC